jgi:hypothetical protein
MEKTGVIRSSRINVCLRRFWQRIPTKIRRFSDILLITSSSHPTPVANSVQVNEPQTEANIDLIYEHDDSAKIVWDLEQTADSDRTRVD